MTDDQLVAAIRHRVTTGEWADMLPNFPASKQPVEMDCSSAPLRPVRRGSPEYQDLLAALRTARLPPPASPEAVTDAEQRIGCPLPRLLRRLYLEVGNGGFGPGYGILGVCGGHTDDLHHSAVDLFPWPWSPPAPPAATAVLLPICHWGCGIHSLVDCADPRAGMWGWDPNGVPPDDRDKALHDQAMTLAEWLERWLRGRLYQPVSVHDPSTGLWRGATDREYATWLAEMES